MILTDKQRDKIKRAFKGFEQRTGHDRKWLAEKIIDSPSRSRKKIDLYAAAICLVSAQRAIKFEKVTGGLIPAKILRPDIFGNGRK